MVELGSAVLVAFKDYGVGALAQQDANLSYPRRQVAEPPPAGREFDGLSRAVREETACDVLGTSVGVGDPQVVPTGDVRVDREADRRWSRAAGDVADSMSRMTFFSHWAL